MRAVSVSAVPPTRNTLFDSINPKQIPCISLPEIKSNPIACSKSLEAFCASSMYIMMRIMGAYSAKFPCARIALFRVLSPKFLNAKNENIGLPRKAITLTESNANQRAAIPA